MNDIETIYLVILILAAAGSVAWTARNRRRDELRGFEVRPLDDDQHRPR